MSDWKTRVKNPRRRILLAFTGWIVDKLGGSVVTAAFGALAIRVWNSFTTDQPRPRAVPMTPEPGHLGLQAQDVVTVTGTASITLGAATLKASGTLGEVAAVLVSVTGTDSLRFS
jgi:hypothetical protein